MNRSALDVYAEIELREYLRDCGCPPDRVDEEVRLFFKERNTRKPDARFC